METIRVHPATTGNDRDADADDRSLANYLPPCLSSILFGEIGMGGWLSWFVECFLFSYLLPTDLDMASSHEQLRAVVALDGRTNSRVETVVGWSCPPFNLHLFNL